ncbi:hypothetical protein LSAT2_022690 [Lamellibrachia satsuma]|nr:hypothetical protein LSAT2_022690 [Lamellibrachia satsuma]
MANVIKIVVLSTLLALIVGVVVGKRNNGSSRVSNDFAGCKTPCRNGGRCVYDQLTEKQRCRCAAGFAGPVCDVRVAAERMSRGRRRGKTRGKKQLDTFGGTYNAHPTCIQSPADSHLDQPKQLRAACDVSS